MGGSETCLIMLAKAFVDLGHSVDVFNNCDGGVFDGVKYHLISEYADSRLPDDADLLISWRNWHLLENRKAHRRYHATHDIPVVNHCPQENEPWKETVDKIVFLNRYHRCLSPWVPSDKALVIPIGIEQEPFQADVARDPARCLYFSHPHRGLDILRGLWPEVKRAVPEATLASFWWEPEHFRDGDDALGILPMRSLNQTELASECLRAGVFSYPCSFRPEISPATTIMAQRGGAFPVVVVQGGMIDTIQYGIKTSVEQFPETLIHTLRQSIDDVLERREMMEWAAKTYCWRSVAQAWISSLLAPNRRRHFKHLVGSTVF